MTTDPFDRAKAQGKKFLTWEELAMSFDVSTRTVQRWVKEGRLPSPKYAGKRAMFPVELVEQIATTGVQMKGHYPVVPNPMSASMAHRARGGRPAGRGDGRQETPVSQPAGGKKPRKRGAK